MDTKTLVNIDLTESEIQKISCVEMLLDNFLCIMQNTDVPQIFVKGKEYTEPEIERFSQFLGDLKFNEDIKITDYAYGNNKI